MAELRIGRSLSDSDVLWRYMSIDKFIDLVDSKTLFFAPLSWYEKTDPFEGYIPHVAMEAMASISRKFRDQHMEAIDKLASVLPEDAAPQIRQLRANVESHLPTMKALFKNISACTMVSCWYKSQHESEGMWNLYSRGGVAIRTSVGAIKAALADNLQIHSINVGAVKYLDFSDKSLTPPDCVTEDGQLIGMIKRIAYAHENEVRMYIARERPKDSLELLTPEPTYVSVNVEKLLEEVVISPFAGKTIENSVHAVCRWSGVDKRIVSKSTLLENCEYLLDAYQ